MTAGGQMKVFVPLAACVGVAVASYAVLVRCRKKEWREGGRVKKLLIYPIKSLPPIELVSAELTFEGVTHEGVRDREFLLLDADNDNEFITARTEPSLLLIDLSFNADENCLQIRSKDPRKNLELLEMPIAHNEGVDTSVVLQVRTWDRNGPYDAHPCDKKVSAWFSKYLNRNVLVVRLISPSESCQEGSPARFQDQAVLNILSDRSVDNLRELIHDPSSDITYRNFRPNILLDTKYPHEEDLWSRVKIGKAETEFHKRCTRCVLTTIDPNSGIKTEKEPLVTMRRYRVDRTPKGKSKYKYQPLFASHHYIRSPGVVSVGQTVLVEEAAREML